MMDTLGWSPCEMSRNCTSRSSMMSDLRVMVKSGHGLTYVRVLGLGEVLFIEVTGRMGFQPCSATGPFISMPLGSRPMNPHAGS